MAEATVGCVEGVSVFVVRGSDDVLSGWLSTASMTDAVLFA